MIHAGTGLIRYWRRSSYPPWILRAGAVLAFGPCLFRIVGGWLGVSFSVSPGQLFVLGVAGISILWLGTRGKVIYVSPVAFSMLFLISYPLRVIRIEMNPSLWNFGNDLGVGRFPFTSDAYWAFVGIAVLGISGLATGQFIMRRRLGRLHIIPIMKAKRNQINLQYYGWLWFGISSAIIVLSKVLGIGSLGLTPVVLPLHLTGLLYFLRILILPLLGMYLFGVALETNRRLQASTLVLMALFLGVVSFPITLSKVSILHALLPYVAYLYICANYSPLGRKLRRSILIITILLLPLIVFGAQAARDVAYSTGHLASANEIAEGFRSSTRSSSVIELAENSYGLIVDRLIGGGELMGVLASPSYSHGLALRVMLGQGTNPDLGFGYVFEDVYGVMVTEGGGVYRGKGLGLFGLLYLSHDPFFLFLLALMLGGLMLWVEDLFLRKTNAGMAAAVGFMVSLVIWEGVFDNLYYYPVFLGGILILARFLSDHKHQYRGINTK